MNKTIRNVVLTAAIAGAQSAAASDRIAIEPSAVDAVAQRVTKEVAPAIEHLTNNEAWFRSRVMLGSIAAIVTSGFSIYALIAAGVTDGELYAPPIGAILGGAFAIYGRMVAKKPLVS